MEKHGNALKRQRKAKERHCVSLDLALALKPHSRAEYRAEQVQQVLVQCEAEAAQHPLWQEDGRRGENST